MSIMVYIFGFLAVCSTVLTVNYSLVWILFFVEQKKAKADDLNIEKIILDYYLRIVIIGIILVWSIYVSLSIDDVLSMRPISTNTQIIIGVPEGYTYWYPETDRSALKDLINNVCICGLSPEKELLKSIIKK